MNALPVTQVNSSISCKDGEPTCSKGVKHGVVMGMLRGKYQDVKKAEDTQNIIPSDKSYKLMRFFAGREGDTSHCVSSKATRHRSHAPTNCGTTDLGFRLPTGSPIDSFDLMTAST